MVEKFPQFRELSAYTNNNISKRNLQAADEASDRAQQKTQDPLSIFKRKEFEWMTNAIVLVVFLVILISIGLILLFYFLRRAYRKRKARLRMARRQEKIKKHKMKQHKLRIKQVLDEMSNQIFAKMKTEFEQHV